MEKTSAAVPGYRSIFPTKGQSQLWWPQWHSSCFAFSAPLGDQPQPGAGNKKYTLIQLMEGNWCVVKQDTMGKTSSYQLGTWQHKIRLLTASMFLFFELAICSESASLSSWGIWSLSHSSWILVRKAEQWSSFWTLRSCNWEEITHPF